MRTLLAVYDRCPRCRSAACHAFACLGEDGGAALRERSRDLDLLIISADALRWELTEPT